MNENIFIYIGIGIAAFLVLKFITAFHRCVSFNSAITAMGIDPTSIPGEVRHAAGLVGKQLGLNGKESALLMFTISNDNGELGNLLNLVRNHMNMWTADGQVDMVKLAGAVSVMRQHNERIEDVLKTPIL